MDKKIGYIFPGQGAQYIGMGQDLYQEFDRAKQIFDRANEVLGLDLAKICFSGPQEKFNKSAICQPAILTFSVAAYEVLNSNFKQIGLKPSACAGLSLGEYAALVACGSLQFEDALRLVHKRGQFMDEASSSNPGTMSCILGLEPDVVKTICQKAQVEIANLNCPGQVVISGSHTNIQKANDLAKNMGAKRVIGLSVSGPFHCSLMAQAAQRLTTELEGVNISSPQIKFCPNVTAEYVREPSQIKELLIKQVAHTTFWQDCVLKMKNDGITIYLEIGPGKVLRGLLQRIDQGLTVINLEKVADFLNLEQKLGGGS